MQYNPLQDKKFWVVIVDGIVTIVVFATKNYYPGMTDLVNVIIGFFQAVTAVLIAGYFQADSAALRAGKIPTHLRLKGD